MKKPVRNPMVWFVLTIAVCSGCSNVEETVKQYEAKGVTVARDINGGVKSIRFAEYEPTDDDLKVLSGISGLREIIGNGRSITDQGFQSLGACDQLTVLSLTDSAVTTSGLSAIQKLERLTELTVSGAKSVDDKAVAAICNMKSLTTVNFDGTAITDAGIASLSNLSTLVSISANQTQLTDASLSEIAKSFPDLEVLHLDKTSVSEAGIASLAECKQLTHLSLRDCQLTDQSLRLLAGVPSLRVLDVAENPELTDSAILQLGKLPDLTSLNVSGSQLTGDGFNNAGFSQLATLMADRTQVEDPAISNFALPTLYSLGLKDTKVTEAGVRVVFATNHQTAVSF